MFVSSESALATNKALYKHQSRNFSFSMDFRHAKKKWGFYYLLFTKGKIQCSYSVQYKVELTYFFFC